MDIYICKKRILDKETLDLLIMAKPIALLAELRKYLVFSKTISCADHRGHSNFKINCASNHFIIFGKEKDKFQDQIIRFCNEKGDIFLLNATSKEELSYHERVFFNNNKKTKNYIGSLKDEYDIHRANRYIFGMADCIKQANDILAGKIRIH